MLVGVAFLPPSFPPSGTQAFYIIKRKNCVYFCNRVYVLICTSFENYCMFMIISSYSLEPLCLPIVLIPVAKIRRADQSITKLDSVFCLLQMLTTVKVRKISQFYIQLVFKAPLYITLKISDQKIVSSSLFLKVKKITFFLSNFYCGCYNVRKKLKN